MRFIPPVGPIEGASSTSISTGSGSIVTSADDVRRHPRQLDGSGDDGGYLVDSQGNSLTSSSLSWRYLGVFLDYCNDNDRRRKLDNNNNNYEYYNNYSCRKALWAAYHDPDYGGQGIAEYSFYQRKSGTWDGSTCRAQTHGFYWPGTRCQRLDCHQANTKLELVGVFKETDGLYDFTEQLFKHQGYCLWDEDKASDEGSRDSGDRSGDNADEEVETYSDYEFMTNLAENWVSGCTQFNDDAVDADGNTLYYDTKPLPEGDMTYGVYIDASCSIESSSLTWSDVMSATEDVDNNGDSNDINGMPSINSLDRWNTLLGDYKICQPCRAYNRVKTSDGSSHSSGDGSGDESYDSGDYEDGDDGEGGKDRWGFNCYDDAGYQNCNQCYKFQSQTNMEPASTDDLVRATAQGTMLGIQVDGTRYGEGYYVAPGRGIRAAKMTSAAFLSAVALVGLGYYHYGKKLHRRVGRSIDGLEYNLNDDDDGWQSKHNRRGRGEANWISYIKTAHYKICSDASSLGAKLKSSMTMPVKATRSRKTRASASSPRSSRTSVSPSSSPKTSRKTPSSFTRDDRTKKHLLVQIKKKDTKLALQEELIRELRQQIACHELAEQGQLIQQLQRKLAYYEFKDDTETGTSDAAVPVAEYDAEDQLLGDCESKDRSTTGASDVIAPVAGVEDQSGADAFDRVTSSRGQTQFADDKALTRVGNTKHYIQEGPPLPSTQSKRGDDVKFTCDGKNEK